MKRSEKLMVGGLGAGVGMIVLGFVASYVVMRTSRIPSGSKELVDAAIVARNRTLGTTMGIAQMGFVVLLVAAVAGLWYALGSDRSGGRKTLVGVRIDAKMLMIDGEFVVGSDQVLHKGARPYLRVIDENGESTEYLAVPGAYDFAIDGRRADLIIEGKTVIGVTLYGEGE